MHVHVRNTFRGLALQAIDVPELGCIGMPIQDAVDPQARAPVRAFYPAALAAGGKDNGPPGIREVYHPNYYGAFVIGPDGHNIEAVSHVAE
jgi:hypothetical protein